MSNQRVLQVIGGGEIGGAENHLLNLMRLLAGSDYEPVLVCLCSGPFAEQAARYGITTHTVPMAHPFDISKTKDIQNIIKSEQIKLVHTHGVRANLVARPAAYKSGIPVITTFHSSLQHDYNNPLAAYAARVVTHLTNRYTNRYIAVSGAIKDYMLTLNIPEQMIDVIYNGIPMNMDRSHYQRSLLRNKLGLPDDAKVIGTVGRLHQVKGHFHLLDAAQQLMKDYPDLYLVIVGDGPLAADYPDQISRRGLTGRVIMPGFCPDVYEYYAIMDIFCLPSLMEGQGLVLLEAMNIGLPVVATRVGGIPEVIRDGINGLLVPAGDAPALATAIARILDNPELAGNLVSHGEEILQQFSLDNMVKKTIAVYDAVTIAVK